ncbi:GEVED domain-containing protein [uncultured Aquimarina sp.]|uniref:GEVED domain-containing protein n=1 Tax=uncultured Aquimarina sp. TaxID=575652 RepID=UPI00261D1588|nr:GEVED domain-containing protein [uncultured Aquimarina sp.]
MKKFLFCLLCCFYITSLFSQQGVGPSTIAKGNYKGKTKPFKDYPTISQSKAEESVKDLTIIFNNLRANEKVNQNALPIGPDPKRQEQFGISANNNLGLNIEGIDRNDAGGALPPDPSGAVGPNHYVHGVNVAIKIFDKSGNVLAGPTSLSDFLGSGNNDGDPIIMYDHLSDRFFVSQFRVSDNALIVAISETPDPTGAYNMYEFPLDAFPDYPHYAIWPDGYYLTANKNAGNTTYVLDRQAMIAGDPDAQIIGFDLPGIERNPNTVFSPEPANLVGNDFPVDVPGYIVYFQDDGWSNSITQDELKIWEIDIDFTNPGNSTISQPLDIPITAFDSVFAPFGTGDVEQPGTSQKVDMIGGVISYAANYRSFTDHNSWLITFNVDVDGNDTAGIRWIELRNSDTEGWSVYQEGTYAPNDGHSRFMGSGCIDALGNIGLAFNIASATLEPGIRYTGRYVNDPLGQMTLAEETIIDGAGVQTISNRFGDYSHLTMDPDQFTFWHTAEYFKDDNIWATRIASFSLTSGLPTDVGVSAIVSPNDGLLTNAETVEVNIRNFGTDPQQNIPVELRVDGVLIATETFTGTVNPNESVSYTFTATVDLSNPGQVYTIEANTVLTGDGLTQNDDASKEVKSLLARDVGVVDISAPSTGSGLGLEDVIVDITNFGGETATNIEVQYILDGGTPVVETVPGPIAPQETASYTFTAQADLSTINVTYTIDARTNFSGDQLASNDDFSKSVTHTVCTPEATAGCNVDGIKQFVLNTINVDDGGSGCNTEGGLNVNGYSDRTNLSTVLSNVDGDNEYILQAQHNWQDGADIEALSVWIDFNDNFIFEPSEQLIAGEFFRSFGVLEDFNLVIPVGANPGSHILRAKAIDTSAGGDINDPCGDFDFGEVHDYTVEIDQTLSVDEREFNNAQLTVLTKPDNKFEISLVPQNTLDTEIYIGVFNMLGQQLKASSLSQIGNEYRINVDMAQATTGLYFFRIGDGSNRFVKTVKVAVQ